MDYIVSPQNSHVDDLPLMSWYLDISSVLFSGLSSINQMVKTLQKK